MSTPETTSRSILKIILPYILFGCLWILFSDSALTLLEPFGIIWLWWSVIKGWIFIAISAALLALLLRARLRQYQDLVSKLAETEARFRNICDNLPDSYVYQYTLDPNGKPRFLYLSAGIEEVHGLKSEQAISDFQFLSRQSTPADLHILVQKEAESLRTLEDFSMELSIRRDDGQSRWIRLKSRPRMTGEGQVVWDGVGTDITERKNTEQQLRHSLSLLDAAARISRFGGWSLNLEDKTVKWSEQAASILEISPKSSLTLEEVAALHVPKFRERFVGVLQECTVNGTVYDEELELITPRGNRVWVRTTGEPIRDESGGIVGAHGALQDISPRKKAEAEMKNKEERIRFALETSLLGAWDLDLVDHSAVRTLLHDRIFGYPDLLPEWTYEMFLNHVDPEDRSLVDALFRQAVEAKQDWNFECRIHRVDGQPRWIWAAGRHIVDESGSSRRMAGVVQDITQRKMAEEELRTYREHLEGLVRKRTEDLETANQRLRELDRLKSMFIASMSHELRTPLNSIIGFTGIILMGMSGEISELQRTQLGMVKSSARHLLALINDVIDVSKIEAGKAELVIESFDLGDLIQDVKDSLAPMAAQKGLKLTTRAPEEADIRSDRRRVRQILVNLAGNALKFTENGEVAIEAESRPPQDCPKGKDGCIGEYLIRVRDTGIGISSQSLPLLFEAFSRIHVQERPMVEGTGLGLHLSLKIADMLGGRITVESEPGQGSTFTLELPRIRGN